MIKTVVCSVGTSAARKLGVRPNDLANWVNSKGSLELAATEMFESFQDFEPTQESNLTRDLSAEIHSLVRIGISSSDRILLFASETPDGHCCALAVEKYLQHYWPGIEVKTESIPGLQVNNAETFRNQGVVEFVKNVTQVIDAYGNVILNPTGGFKALVPYTVLLGMLKGVKCDYIFERSTSLLELPPLPVEFKRSQFESYKEIFETIDRDSFISQQEWEDRVPYQERLLLDPLIETSNEGITLSAIGFLFLDAMQRPSNLVPFLSRKALDDCFDNVIKLENCDPFRFLNRVASSSAILDSNKHLPMEKGLWWLKPGNTKDRYLISVEGWRLLVWRVIRKDQEGDKYPQTVTVSPERDRRKYLPFIRMEYLNE
jgi:putative CRISPR-associated protein (TIGR02619 family)